MGTPFEEAPKADKEPGMDWERQVLDRFRRGQVEAFEQVVLRYQERLYNVIYRMSGDESETRDVVQETFLQAFRSFGKFRGESKIGTWLHRIAVNFYLTRRNRPHAESYEGLDLENSKTPRMDVLRRQAATPEEVFEEKEIRRLLEKAIAGLPEEYRTVLVLRDLEEHSANETAEILEISVPAVKSRLHRARLFVRQGLREAAFSETPSREPGDGKRKDGSSDEKTGETVGVLDGDRSRRGRIRGRSDRPAGRPAPCPVRSLRRSVRQQHSPAYPDASLGTAQVAPATP